MDKPKALVITRNLPPYIGGMERLIWHVVNELASDYRLHVIGPSNCKKFLSSTISASEVPIKPLWRFLLETSLKTINSTVRLRPQLIFAGSGLTAPFAWLAARLTGKRCVIYLHGLDIETRHPLYRLFWRPFFRRCDRVLVNSYFTCQLALDAGVSTKRISVLHPGVNLPVLAEANQQRDFFRKQYDLGNAPLMLYVGRITTRKGLANFVQDCLPAIIDKHPDAKLVVVGDEPKHALNHQHGEKQRVCEILAANGLHDRLIFLSEIDDESLKRAYFGSDVLIFPIQDRPNDHEGFGMVALEAAAHGLPTVAFAVGGVTDAISEGNSGNLVKPEDTNAFQEKVIERLEDSPSAKAAWVDNAYAFASNFVWPTFGQKLRQFCQADRANST